MTLYKPCLDDDFTPTIVGLLDGEDTLTNGLEPIEARERITIRLSYPLTGEHAFTVESTGGWTLGTLSLEIARLYRRVYDEESTAVGDPGHIPGMLNRARSSGPYGIWGHDISDLFLEGIEQVSPDVFKPLMGS